MNFFVILSLVVVSGCAGQPQVSQSNCKILIERPENNGSINIVPCIVELSTGQKIILSGGQTNSFSVKPGAYFLTATSLNPYPDATKDSDWESSPVKITVTNLQVMKILAEPKSEGSAYIGGWVLQQQL
jgi:hypothetical protein